MTEKEIAALEMEIQRLQNFAAAAKNGQKSASRDALVEIILNLKDIWSDSE